MIPRTNFVAPSGKIGAPAPTQLQTSGPLDDSRFTTPKRVDDMTIIATPKRVDDMTFFGLTYTQIDSIIIRLRRASPRLEFAFTFLRATYVSRHWHSSLKLNNTSPWPDHKLDDAADP